MTMRYQCNDLTTQCLKSAKLCLRGVLSAPFAPYGPVATWHGLLVAINKHLISCTTVAPEARLILGAMFPIQIKLIGSDLL